MDVSLAALAGLQPTKPSKFAPLGTKRFFTGLYTSRSPLLEPGTRAETRFYGGRPDALWDGLNCEISADNTLIRRPGFSLFNTLTSPVENLYTFRPPNAPLKVMGDTSTGVYVVPGTGGPTKVFTKSSGSGQTFFQGVGAQLFMSDGVDLLKWDGTNLWNWGITAPTVAPSLSIKGGTGPSAPSLATTAGGTLTGQGTLYVRTTFVNEFGETQASSEGYIAVPDNQELVVSSPASPPSNATGWNCYIGKSAGGEILQNSSPIAIGVNYTLTTTPALTGNVPPGSSSGTYTITSQLGVSYVYCYSNSRTAHVSTASPVSAYTGAQSKVQVQLSGIGSIDVQVDQVEIYRTTDGGATYMLLATIANPSGGGNWSYTDTGTSDQQLNAEVLAPQALANNPPPSGLQNLSYFAGRIWGTVGNYLYYSNGPNTTNGSGNESWPPLNYVLLPSQITRLVPYANGMLIFTVDDLYQISAPGYAPVMYQAGLGCLNYSAVATGGSAIYVFTSDCNLVQITPDGGVYDLGFAIAGEFESWNPANVSVAHHIFGHKDSAVFVCDGNGNFFRCNPNQQPEGGAVWSPQGTIVAGASLLSSIETQPGVRQLLASSGNNLLYRNWAVQTDNAAAYSAWVVIGSIVLALPGQLCEVESVTVEAAKLGSNPYLSVLLGEISGTFESLPVSVPDPPLLPAAASIYGSRYYLNQSQKPIVCRNLQLKVDFGQDTVQNELLSYSLYGAIHPE